MTTWHTRTYEDPASGDVVARYVSLDGENWLVALSSDEVTAREEARRAIRTDALEEDGREDPERSDSE